MPRPKRVSIKGRGADLFFGDTSSLPGEPDHDDDSTALEARGSQTADDRAATTQPSKPATNKARLQPSNNATRAAPERSVTQGPPMGSADNPVAEVALEVMWDAVATPATLATTFRYTEEELSRLTDVLYELTKRSRAKLSKQDIARIGLNLVLWDYEARGDASLLSQYAIRRANRR